MVQCNSLFKLFGSLLSRGGGACRTSIFHSLNKDQQPPTRHRANLSSPGHEKSAQLNKRATEWAPGARRNCRKRGHLSSKLPPDRCPPFLPHSRLRRGLSWTAEHKRTGCEAAREAGNLQESAVALGEGVVPETRRPERHRGVSPPSPCWTRSEDWSRAPHSPSPTRSRKLNPSLDIPAATKLWSVHTLCCPQTPHSVKVYPKRPWSPSPGKPKVSVLCDPEGWLKPGLLAPGASALQRPRGGGLLLHPRRPPTRASNTVRCT